MSDSYDERAELFLMDHRLCDATDPECLAALLREVAEEARAKVVGEQIEQREAERAELAALREVERHARALLGGLTDGVTTAIARHNLGLHLARLSALRGGDRG